MTAQVEDSILIDNDSFSIVAISRPIKFKPQKYGMTPFGACTGCRRGFWCDYQLTKEGIFLEALHIYSLNKKHPKINGVLPTTNEGEDEDFCEYKDLHLRIRYTGKILVGNGFLDEFYVHMGFQQPWAFECLKELVFRNGVLKKTVDRSVEAAREREMLREESRADREWDENPDRFIRDCFSLDYKKKAKWLIKRKQKALDNKRGAK